MLGTPSVKVTLYLRCVRSTNRHHHGDCVSTSQPLNSLVWASHEQVALYCFLCDCLNAVLFLLNSSKKVLFIFKNTVEVVRLILFFAMTVAVLILCCYSVLSSSWQGTRHGSSLFSSSVSLSTSHVHTPAKTADAFTATSMQVIRSFLQRVHRMLTPSPYLCRSGIEPPWFGVSPGRRESTSSTERRIRLPRSSIA